MLTTGALAIARLIGVFLGAVLAECGPVLVQIIREATRDTVEDGQTRDSLRERLIADLPVNAGGLRDKGSPSPSGGASSPARPGQGEGVGG